MSSEATNKTINELRELGFPESVVQETARALDRGLFRIKPSSDLVERTIAQIKERKDVRFRLAADEGPRHAAPADPAEVATWLRAYGAAAE